MLIAEFSITPIGVGVSMSPWIARAVDVIDKSGLEYQVGPMGTYIRGEWDDIARVAGEALRAVVQDCDRVTISLRADFRRGEDRDADARWESIAHQLGRPIQATQAARVESE